MIKIANAPCSWGALEFDLQGKPATFDVVLDEMQKTGYEGTELGDWGFMPTDPDVLKKELAKRSLTMLGAFVPVALNDETTHQKGEEAALKVARLLSAVEGSSPVIVLADNNGSIPERTQNAGRVTPEMGLSEAEWKTFAKGVERIAKAVKSETGMRLVFHHHCGGYVETPAEIDKLLALTDPSLVGICLDTGHYQFAGGDPVKFLQANAKRVWHMHFKDCEPAIAEQSRKEGWDYFKSVEKGVFCELGKGAVDFKSVKAELEKQGYEGWIVVEQDVLPGMGKPFDSALRNRQYIKSIGL
ncbi:MAG: inosose dehydratase [Chloroflexi bacterium]|nr:MAG: inosose dehydratase [Chloroflexota bacterium]